MQISFGSAIVFEVAGPTSAKEIQAWDLLARGKNRQADRLLKDVIAENPSRGGIIESTRMLAVCQANDMKAALRKKPKQQQLQHPQLKTLSVHDSENCGLLSGTSDSQSDSGESINSMNKPVYERDTAGLRHRALGGKRYVELRRPKL